MKKHITLAFILLSYILSSQVTLITNTSTWKYKDDGSNQGSSWYGTAFNDASWASGPAELGYGDGDEATVVNACGTTTPLPSCSNKYITTYFRQTFSVASIANFTAYTASLRRDDGIVLYINGLEVYRNNMPTGTISNTTPASTACSDDGATVFTTTIASSLITTGTNVIAAEIHQNVGTSSDISFILNLVGNTNTVAPVTPTVVKGPYLVVGTPTTMIVRWETNVATDSQVMFGTNSASLSTIVTNTTVSVTHTVQLSSLTPYTKYYYNIGSTTLVTQGDTNNNFLTSPLPGTPGKYRFWMVGDCGNASTNQINCKNQYLLYNGGRSTNGMLLSGDNAYNSGTNSEYNAEFFGIYQPDALKKMPLWSAPGNHDYNNGASTATTVPYFTYFTTPTNGEAGGVASNNPAYYSFDYGNIHFLSLDSYGTTGASQKMYDTTSPQVVWIKADLAANTKKWTVAYWHHPPYTMGSHNSDTESDLVAIRTNFIRILERNRVDMIICGHSHDYERSKLMNGHYGNEASFNASTHNLSTSSGLYDGSANSCPYTKDSVNNKIGTVYILSGSAGQLGGQQTSFPHNAMHYSNASNGGTFIMDFDDNKFDGKWLCADGVIRDQFTIVKDVKSVKNYTMQPGQSATLTASWPGNYVWNNSATTRSIVVSPTANATYYASDTYTCIADTFKINLTPASSFTTLAPFCVSSPVQFNNLSSNSPTSWSWSVNPSASISSATVQNPAITFSASGIYSVTLLASNIYGIGIPSTQTILINTNPVLSAVSGNSAVCSGQSLTLSLSGALTYSWTGIGTGSSIVVSPNTNTIYNVTGFDINGCSSIAQKSITVNVVPSISITSNPSNAIICSGNTLMLTASGGTSYVWNNGVSNGSSFTPSISSVYSVTVTGSNGCQSMASIASSVNPTPTISIITIPSVPTVCQGGTVNLNASGAGTYSWTNNVTNNTVFTPTASAILTVTGTLNSCSSTSTIGITVNSLPTVVVTSSPSAAIVCAGNTLMLSASGATSYVWSGGITNNSTFTPTASANYSVISTGSNGCQTISIKSITVNAIPSLSASTNPTTGIVCQGSSITLIGSGATTYTWTGGITNGTPFVPVQSTSYTLTGIDNNGCSNTLSRSITVNGLPTVVISGTNAICAGQSLSLTASGAQTYTWSNGSNNATILLNPSVTTIYSVTGTNLNACTNTSSMLVTVNSLPTVSLNSGTICAGQNFTFNPSGATTYTISGSSFIVSPLINTTYVLSGSNAFNCVSQIPASATVVVNPKPILNVLSDRTVCCIGESVSLTVSGANSYSWSTLQSNTLITVSPTTSSTYSVSGLNSFSCSTIAAITVSVNQCTDIDGLSLSKTSINVYPNPNNGNFKVEIGEGGHFQFEVFNSLGQLIINRKLYSGTHDVEIESGNGIYLYKLLNSKIVIASGKMVIQR